MIKHLLLSLFLVTTTFHATSQVVEGGPTNGGTWPDKSALVWKCPESGPVISIPFIFLDSQGITHKGVLTCGVEDGTKITKPVSPTQKTL